MVGALVGIINVEMQTEQEGQFFLQASYENHPDIEDPKVVTFHELCKWKANINAFSLGGKRL
jgi:Fe-S-cluster formation regulator IscX/YfhJ